MQSHPPADIHTVHPAPFVSTAMTVEPGWIDYNGHLNMAYYNVLFDRCCDEALLPLGLGPDYVRDRGATFFTAEAHVCYLRELAAGMTVTVTYRILDFDAKRLHGFQELHHATEGWLSATCETMCLHVDMAERTVTPWPDDVAARISAMAKAHAALPRPPRAGRIIQVPR